MMYQSIKLRGIKLATCISLCAGFAFTLFGTDQGAIGSLLTLPAWVEAFPEIDTINTTGAQLNHNTTIQGPNLVIPFDYFRLIGELGFVSAIFQIGGLCGAITCMIFGDKLGRRRCLFIGAFVAVIGAILQAAAFSLAQLIVGRIVMGWGVGMGISTAPTYQAECAKVHHRGSLGALQAVYTTVGIWMALWIDYGFYYTKGSLSWRFPLAFQVVFGLIIMAMIPFLPETPRWLVEQDRYEDARYVLAALADVPLDDPTIDLHLTEIKASFLTTNKLTVAEFFNLSSPAKYFQRTMLAGGFLLFAQCVGIDAITYYGTVIFEQYIGLSPTDSRILAAAVEMMQCASSIVAVFVVDRAGRRRIVLFGTVGLIFTLAGLAGTIAHPTSKACGVAAAVLLFIYNFFYPIGYISICFLYAPEISPLRSRALGSGFATVCDWIFGFLIVEVTPIMFKHISYGTYLVFLGVNVIALFVFYFLYPETSHRSLEEMDMIFANSSNLFDAVRLANEMPRRYGDRKHQHEIDIKDIEKRWDIQSSGNGNNTGPIEQDDIKVSYREVENTGFEGVA